MKRDHWAFQGLQRLVEKHGCENGYQDRTFRGDRAMPRYEFAAALNPCLNKEIERLNGNTDIFNIDNEEQERSQKVLGFLDTRLRDQQRRSELLENRLRTLEINR